MLQQRAPRRREAEVGVARQCHGGTAIVARRGLQRAEDARGVQLLRDQQLRGAEALQLQRQRQQRHLRRRELRRRDVGVGQSREVPLQRHGRDEVVGPLVQQARLHHRPRRDDAHDVALDEPGAGRGVADLLADGHLVAAPDEPRQVALERVRGHAGHGHALSLAHVAARQHDVELRRRRARVLVEGLVEVAEPEEDDGVGVARLHLEVLPAQGGHGGRSGTVAVDGGFSLLAACLARRPCHRQSTSSFGGDCLHDTPWAWAFLRGRRADARASRRCAVVLRASTGGRRVPYG